MATTVTRLQEIEAELQGNTTAAQLICLYWSDDPQPCEWNEGEEGPWVPHPFFCAELEDGSHYGEGATVAQAIDELLKDLRR